MCLRARAIGRAVSGRVGPSGRTPGAFATVASARSADALIQAYDVEISRYGDDPGPRSAKSLNVRVKHWQRCVTTRSEASEPLTYLEHFIMRAAESNVGISFPSWNGVPL